MSIPRVLAVVLVAVCLLGSPAHSQGMLGVGIVDSQVDPKGAFVSTVQPGSPAAAAGIVPGDVIIGADGAPVAGAAELQQIVASHAAGAALRLEVVHYGGAPTEVAVTLGSAPPPAQPHAKPQQPKPLHRQYRRPAQSRRVPTSAGPAMPIPSSMPSRSTYPRAGASPAARGG